MNDIQTENNILINDLNKKEEEYSKLLEEKIDSENKCSVQFEEQEKKFNEIQNNVEILNKENDSLKNKIAECVDVSTNQLKSLNDSVIKSSVKMESYNVMKKVVQLKINLVKNAM